MTRQVVTTKSGTRRLLESIAPELRDLDPHTYLRRELQVPDDETLEGHVANFTLEERSAAIGRLATAAAPGAEEGSDP